MRTSTTCSACRGSRPRPGPRSISIRRTACCTITSRSRAFAFGMHAEPLPAPDRDLSHGDKLRVGGLTFRVRHAPGHSPGSVVFEGQGVAFGGDVLFQGSIGRTDLPGGDFDTLLKSIERELLTLPDSTIVYSGHGPETTVGHERRANPFLTGAYRHG